MSQHVLKVALFYLVNLFYKTLWEPLVILSQIVYPERLQPRPSYKVVPVYDHAAFSISWMSSSFKGKSLDMLKFGCHWPRTSEYWIILCVLFVHISAIVDKKCLYSYVFASGCG